MCAIPRAIERSASCRHRADRRADWPLAARTQAAYNQDPRPGRCGAGQSGARLPMVHVVSAQQDLWTSSYVLVAAGYSLALFTLVFWAIEQKGWRRGWTWVWMVFGANAIAAYMFSELLPSTLYNVHWNAGGQRVNLLGYVFRSSIRAHPQSGLGRLCLFGFLHGRLFCSRLALYARRSS